MIRRMRKSDRRRLKELENGFAWQFGQDFIKGLVAVDENDKPVMFAGAWSRAEVHIALDKKWSTPGARHFLLRELHDAMAAEMKRRKVGQAVTWFDEAKDRFKDRLQSWGWVKSQLTSWHKEL